jgi:hypothetical protein
MKKPVFVMMILWAQAALAAEFDPNTDPSLLGWWNFDEGSGTVAADSSGRGNHGELMNGPVWVTGKIGGALQFDGVDDYVQVPHHDSLVPTNNEVTVSVWINAERHTGPNGAQWQGILSKGDAPRLYSLYTEASGALHFSTGPSGAFVGTLSASQVPLREWVHIAVVVSGGQHLYYINGVAAGVSGSGATLPTDSTSVLTIGKTPTETDREFQGMIDEVRLYGRALTVKEIKKLIPPRLKAYAPLPVDGATGVTAPLLQWTPGETALLHDVYVGANRDLTAADLQATRQPFAMLYFLAGIEPGVTYYWRVDEIDLAGNVFPGDVWTFTAQDLKAYLPTPADGAADVSPTAALTWEPGQTVVKHHVYLSDDRDAVTQGTPEADRGETEIPAFAPEGLTAATDYYWRVDEIAFGDEVRTGRVWSFTTHLPVDDFEAYNDEEGQSTRIYESWIDGYADNSSGSVVGNLNPPFAERTVVHGGSQAMPMDYNNINTPYFSEAHRAFAPVQDWTVHGVDTLALFFRGSTSNGAGRLYVAVEDDAGNVATVTMDVSLTSVVWVPVSIPSSEFTGVDLTRVEVLYLGVGDRDAPTPGGAGRIYIDDIRVMKAAPAAP